MSKNQKSMQCRTKIAYPNIGKAFTATGKFLASNGTKLTPYACRECANIHLTKSDNNRLK